MDDGSNEGKKEGVKLTAKNRPYFSIVIPVFNREKEIVRAVNSCLTQSFDDMEIVIVDDASEDETVTVIKRLLDPRIVLICHEVNRNVCPARNTGVTHSRGEWVIFLDSDDEFLPGALEKLHGYITESAQDISLGFLRQRDDGRLSPEPVSPEFVLDYETYITWSEELTLSDFVHCTRRHTFEKVKYPESRAYEEGYLLDYTKLYKIRMIPEPLVAMHLDSSNRITTNVDGKVFDRLLSDAGDHKAEIEYILTHHGEALCLHGPNQFRVLCKSQVLFAFLAGKRKEGIRLGVSYLREYPSCIQSWVVCLAGLIGPRVLARIKMWKFRWHNWRQQR